MTPRGWAVVGGACGLLLAAIAFAPAAWLARGVARASGERLLLVEPRGTLWSGSAIAVLAGGPGSRDASALPDRLAWTLRPTLQGLDLRLRQACCINGELRLRLAPGLNRLRLGVLPPAPSTADSADAPADAPGNASSGGQLIGQWPAAWLIGLGAPWNALQLGGVVQLGASGLEVEQVAGRTRLSGEAFALLLRVATPLVPLPMVGSYRVGLHGDAARGDASTIRLQTLEGPLQASGEGQLGAGGLRFRGQVSAPPEQEGALSNLLNIIGRRNGAQSVITIG